MLTMTATPEADLDRPPLDYPAGRDMANDRAIPDSAKSVYCHLAGKLGFVQFTVVKVWATSHLLGRDREHFAIALKRLTEHGYLEAAPSGDSRARAYRLIWDRQKTQGSSAV